MNLREKTLIVMGASLILVVLILYITAQMELFLGFSKLEEEVIHRDVERALKAISSDLDSMEGLADHWASRNDTVAFLKEGDATFIVNNREELAEESLSKMGINLLLFMDSFGQIAFSRYLDENGSRIEIPSDLSDQLSFYGFCPGCLDKQSKYSGIILISNEPLLVVTNPVIMRRGDGASAGRVVLGRFLTDREITRLSKTTQLHMTIKSLKDENMSSDFKDAKISLTGNDSVLVRILDNDSIAGYALLNNIYNNPLLILRIDSTRAIYLQGLKSLRSFVILFSLADIFLFMLTLLFLDRYVLSRLSLLTTGVARIGKSQNIASRLAIRGKDELSGLASSINGMLDALGQAHEEIINSERRYKAVVEEQSDLILRTLTDGTITYCNEVFCRFFSNNQDMIVGKKIDSLIPTENLQPAVDIISGLIPDNSTVSFVSLFKRPEGRRWIQWTSHGIFNQSGSLIEVQSVGRDITELKMAEEALKQSERRQADIIEFMPDAILAIDLDGRVMVWNKAMERLTGVKADNMLGEDNYEHALPFYGFRRPILVDMVLTPFKQFENEYASFKKEGNAVLGEIFIPRLGPNGSYLLAKAATLYNAAGDKVGAIESIKDITERRNMEQKLDRTKTELHIAAEIQKSFIPKKTPDIPEFEIEATSIPAMEVGGDFYDFIVQPDGKYGIVIADVAGKSIPAAIFMALSRTIIRANATSQSKVSKVAKNANKMIASDAPTGMFVTLIYGVLDGETLSLHYVNAGHPPPLIFRSADSTIEEEVPMGIVMGIIDDAQYKESRIKFSSGDMAIFYTDGITEAMNSQGEMYGVKRLMDVIQDNCLLETREILNKILIDISNFSRNTEQHDDITLIVIKAIGQQRDHCRTKMISTRDNIPKIVSYIDKKMSAGGFDREQILELQVAVEEAYVNIINHGYKKEEGPIWVTFDCGNRLFKVTLEDEAPRFDPTLFIKRDHDGNIQDHPVGGWGINIMRSQTDEMRYVYNNNKNKLVLIKKNKMK
ncbi:MAG: SpoIIE family protein phosphatase [Methanothrix sp.]|nr:SpoIIE family protein phosphatase [Methanothrix sp.]